MRLLLDTHTFLWALTQNNGLSADAQNVLLDAENDLYLSSISCYEIAYKFCIGKLPGYDIVAENPVLYAMKLGTQPLGFTAKHAVVAGSLEWPHRDPFDRMLAAQAIVEKLVLVTADKEFAVAPGVEIIW